MNSSVQAYVKDTPEFHGMLTNMSRISGHNHCGKLGGTAVNFIVLMIVRAIFYFREKEKFV